jgi:hypothetical protein
MTGQRGNLPQTPYCGTSRTAIDRYAPRLRTGHASEALFHAGDERTFAGEHEDSSA